MPTTDVLSIMMARFRRHAYAMLLRRYYADADAGC